MAFIRDKLQTIGANIKHLSSKYQRSENTVNLLAVSKKHGADKIRQAYEVGQIAFGENYLQELQEKQKELSDLDIEWHFIGPLQSNKTKKIAETVSWVHAINRFKIAKRLSDQRPEELPPISVCIQVNISGEDSKSGVSIQDLPTLAYEVSELSGITLRGLMVIPSPEKDFEKQRVIFAKVKNLQEQLNKQGFNIDTLSMGMSGDMEAAIAEGATIVRIGTAIFGDRE
jgi:pyridoxal phosphate enzyme (YggS family)